MFTSSDREAAGSSDAYGEMSEIFSETCARSPLQRGILSLTQSNRLGELVISLIEDGVAPGGLKLNMHIGSMQAYVLSQPLD